MEQRKKIAFAASSGGHLTEILQLSGLCADFDAFLLTEKKGKQEIQGIPKVYYTEQINRHDKQLLKKIVALVRESRRVLAAEKPEYMISTGAMAAFPICLLGKMSGCKIIYVESFARVTELSLTGKLVYRFSDLFIVQWEQLQRKYPKAIYGGKIFK